MWIVLWFLAACDVLEFVRPIAPRMPVSTWLRRVWSANALQVAAALAVLPLWWWLATMRTTLFAVSTRIPPLAAGLAAHVVYPFVHRSVPASSTTP